jgi:ABC-2 type transport system permease protein
MFRHIASFEWRYQLRSPVFWVGCVLFFLITFGSVTVEGIQIGGRGAVNLNSPYAIIVTLSTMAVFAIFVVVAMVAGTVIRDDETGFAPILRSTSIGKSAYLGGRFTGSVAAALLVLACMPLAIALGSFMPWLDSEKLGPFVPGHYLYALFVFGLPTLLIVSAVFFALATATRSMMWTYIGAVAFVVLYVVSRVVLRDPQLDTVAALADPFGLSALRIATKYWTAAERNTLLPPLSGLLLANRLIWLGVALLMVGLAWRLFRFETRSGAVGPAAPATAATAQAAPKPRSGVLPAPQRDAATRRAQLWALARFDMAFVFRSPAFFVLLFLGVLNAVGSMWFTGEWYGSDTYPVTRLMVQALQNAFTFIQIIIAVFYAGELVWRQRERKVHEIIDATAAPDWAHLVPKVLAIALVLGATSGAGVLTGMAVQLAKGYTTLEPVSYLLWFWLPSLISALQLAALAVFVQVLVPQKFYGWGLMLVYIVATVAMSGAGFEHLLYNFGSTPPVPLSDMNGMARFWVGQAWLQALWSAFALLLLVLAYGLWPRGTALALKPRLRALPRRLHGKAGWLGAMGLLAWLGLSGFVFYNTNVLNDYRPQQARDAVLAQAERELLAFESLPVPLITAVTLDVQLFPREARAQTTGSYRIENRTAAPIGQLHVNWPERLRLDRFELPGATLEHQYPQFPYRIYRLQPALMPGEVRLVSFATTLEERGFPNGAPLTRIVENGSFLENAEITPGLGMSRDGLLTDRAKRRKHGLPADLRPPTLEDETGRQRSGFRTDSDWVTADITVGTDADQTPIAPGQVVSDTVAGGRRTARFRTDAPINHFFSIQSARYEVRRDKAGEVDLAVYFHPGHGANVDRMLAAMKASLALFGEQFSPYQFKQARVLEFPGYANFAQAFANTIPYSENIGFLTRLGSEEEIDLVTYVTAHEIAHQWWGHQMSASNQQGASMLVESFAQYSALLVMERLYGREQMRRFLRYELDKYLRSRSGEVVEELPLARVENQPHIHYQKGSLVMYWLKEAVGEAVVNRALAGMLKAHAFKEAPYPNTLDFLKLLRAEAGPQHHALITDLFEKITLLDVKAGAARSVRRADGRFEVSFEVDAKKFYADGQGRETEAPLAEPFDIGVFDAEPGSAGFKAASVLAFERRELKTGRQTVTVVVDREPAWVGVDPYNKRIDRNSGDNLVKIGGD